MQDEHFLAEDQAPIAAIRYQTHVTEWFLRAASPLFNLGEEVGEFDEHVSETSSLMHWEYKNTGDVVETTWSLLFREVADKVFAIFVVFCHDVEKEWLDVIVKSLTAEK
jgi:hypothetical protein